MQLPNFVEDSGSYEFNLWINGREDRIVANRVMLCIMTEYGLVNSVIINAQAYNNFISKLQDVTGETIVRHRKHPSKANYVRNYTCQE